MALHSLCQFKGAGRVARCGLVEARPAVAFHAHVLRPRDRARPFKPHIFEACTCRSYAGSGPSSSTSGSPRREAQLESLRGELRALEEERDTAVRTAESCARTCVRLADMTQLLEDLALEKVKAGDEAGAKLVLQEKAALREIIEGSNSKAQTNFALAGKLAALIGSKHSQLLELMAAGGQTPGAGAGAGAGTATSSSSSSSSSWAAGPSYPTNGAGGAGGGGSSWPQPPTTSTSTTFSSPGQQQLPWERSLRDAQERVRQAESEAAQLGRLAALSAEDGIAAARERLRQRREGAGAGGREDILQARERLRSSAVSSLAAARERLRAQDAAVLEYCRRIVSRYRRGEAVGEEELEFAFEQLERRLY